MPPKGKKREAGIRFTMDTKAFVLIWRNSVEEKDWESFCHLLWNRFTKDTDNPTNKNNRKELDEWKAGWKKWSNEERYRFISERADRKIQLIKSRAKKALEKDGDTTTDVDTLLKVHKGHDARPTAPGKQTKALTITQILDTFRGPAKPEE